MTHEWKDPNGKSTFGKWSFFLNVEKENSFESNDDS